MLLLGRVGVCGVLWLCRLGEVLLYGVVGCVGFNVWIDLWLFLWVVVVGMVWLLGVVVLVEVMWGVWWW